MPKRPDLLERLSKDDPNYEIAKRFYLEAWADSHGLVADGYSGRASLSDFVDGCVKTFAQGAELQIALKDSASPAEKCQEMGRLAKKFIRKFSRSLAAQSERLGEGDVNAGIDALSRRVNEIAARSKQRMLKAELAVSASSNGGNRMNLTSLQKDLLIAIVEGHLSNSHAAFFFGKSHTGMGLCFEGGQPVRFDADGSDFLQLQKVELLNFEPVGPNLIRGKPTQLGIDTVGSLAEPKSAMADTTPEEVGHAHPSAGNSQRDSQYSAPVETDGTFVDSAELFLDAYAKIVAEYQGSGEPKPPRNPVTRVSLLDVLNAVCSAWKVPPDNVTPDLRGYALSLLRRNYPGGIEIDPLSIQAVDASKLAIEDQRWNPEDSILDRTQPPPVAAPVAFQARQKPAPSAVTSNDDGGDERRAKPSEERKIDEPLDKNPFPEGDPRHDALAPFFEVMEEFQVLAEEYPTLFVEWQAEAARWHSWPPPFRLFGEAEGVPCSPGSDLHIKASAGEAGERLLGSPESWFDPFRDPWLDVKDKEPWERWFYAIREFWLNAREEAEDARADMDEFAKAAEAMGYRPSHNPLAVGERVWRKMVKSKKSLQESMQELGLSSFEAIGQYEEPVGWVQRGKVEHLFTGCAYFCGVLAARRVRELEKAAESKPASGESDVPLAEPPGTQVPISGFPIVHAGPSGGREVPILAQRKAEPPDSAKPLVRRYLENARSKVRAMAEALKAGSRTLDAAATELELEARIWGQDLHHAILEKAALEGLPPEKFDKRAEESAREIVAMAADEFSVMCGRDTVNRVTPVFIGRTPAVVTSDQPPKIYTRAGIIQYLVKTLANYPQEYRRQNLSVYKLTHGAESSKPPIADASQTQQQAPGAKKRGRKNVFTSEQLHEARRMKQARKSNNEIAKVLYRTPTPTPEQRRSVPTTLKYHFERKQ